MALPQHVRQMAKDAVGHKETTAMIQHYANDNSWQPFNQPQSNQQRSLAPDQLKAQAKDAVSHPETMAQIRLASVNSIDAPMATPSRDNMRASHQIAQMQRSGQGADSIHQSATKDNFSRSGYER